jgi:hypothetical protein
MDTSTAINPTGAPAEKPNARTEAALGRLHQAMRAIEADIQANHGIYPLNFGRVTQSELCRRADVKKATLQNPVHKDTTRVEIMAWLDALNAHLTQTRAGTRDRVTAVADTLSADLAHLSQTNQALVAQLEAAETLIKQLKQENALLKSRLGIA